MLECQRYGAVGCPRREAAGLDVLVLEARHRVGGRAYTRHDLHDAQYAEGGAEFLDLDHSLMAPSSMLWLETRS